MNEPREQTDGHINQLHQDAMEACALAEKQTNSDLRLSFYAKAFNSEFAAGKSTDKEPTRSVLLRSAAWIALDCGQVSWALSCIREAVSNNGIHPDIKSEFAEVLERIAADWRGPPNAEKIPAPQPEQPASEPAEDKRWEDCLRRGECPACGATDAKDAETKCRPVGDSCVACDERLLGDQEESAPASEPPATVVPTCSGCGLPEMHKMCVAHGTDVYMNAEHEAWGNRVAIEYLRALTTARETIERLTKELAAKTCPRCDLDGYWFRATRIAEQRAIAAEKFKAWVHNYLDSKGIPADPDPEANKQHGCRISGRMAFVFDKLTAAESELARLRATITEILGWDCLHPKPATHILGDLAWLKEKLQAALKPITTGDAPGKE